MGTHTPRKQGVTQPAVHTDAVGTEGRPAIEVSQLRKTYGKNVAVDDVSFSVAEGEIFGLLGPNGAGKTTAIECAVGLRTPDSGRVAILGLDPTRDRERLRSVVGVQLQSSALPAKLKVGELLDLYQSFYAHPANVQELAETLGLAEKSDEYYESLSGGLKQRLSLALALVGRPKVAVLDEMTTGLDPHAKRDTWALIEKVRDGGVTVVLVTHDMEEAERLCDEVALVDRGRVVAAGTPEELAGQSLAGKQLRFVPSAPFDQELLTVLPEVAHVERHGRRVLVRGSGDLVNAVVLTLAAAGVTAHDVELTSPNLEDAFIELTGHGLESGPQTPPPRSVGARRARRRATRVLPSGISRGAFAKLVRSEARLARRQPVGPAVGLVLPLVLVLLFGSLPVMRERTAVFGGHSFFEIYFPTIIALVLTAPALFSLPIPLATYREQGILRRLSTTPVPQVWLLAAQLLVHLSLAAVGLVLLMLLGLTAFGLGVQSVAGLVFAVMLAGIAVFGIGLWISGIARTGAMANGFALVTFYILMFFAGLFIPLAELPAVVGEVGQWTPLGAAVAALQHAMFDGFPSASSLLVLAAYAALFAWLAIRYFRWE